MTHVSASDGVKLYAESSGPESAAPIVCVHELARLHVGAAADAGQGDRAHALGVASQVARRHARAVRYAVKVDRFVAQGRAHVVQVAYGDEEPMADRVARVPAGPRQREQEPGHDQGGGDQTQEPPGTGEHRAGDDTLAPRTGRTHQLRVAMQHIRTPILGDPLYARRDQRFPDATLMLHARRLAIVLPGEEAPRVFESPLPARFLEVLAQLKTAG